MNELKIKNIKEDTNSNINIKHLYIYMDETINGSLNEGNIHFFFTINFKNEINKKNELKEKISELEKILENIEMISWYNIIAELNNKKNYHLHGIIAIKSIIGYNNCIENNIKILIIKNYEIDTKLNTCWDFINIKKSWRYMFKTEEKEKKEKLKINKKKIKKIKKDINNLDPIFENNEDNEKKEEEVIKKKKLIYTLKIKNNDKNLFESIKKELKVKIIEDKGFDFLKGVKMEEKNYSERQIIFLWEFFLLINNLVIYNNKLYKKIEKSMISYFELENIEFLYDNFSDILFFFRKNFKNQFENFDEVNFISKYLRNKNEKIIRLKEFTGRKVNFNFNILEFKDGIYSILHNKFIRTQKFEKNYKIKLQDLLINKNILTIKYYNYSYENLKEPTIWLESIEKVLGLKKRSNSLGDEIAKFLKKDDIKTLLIYLAYIFHYSTNELNKKNTLYVWGPSNTGKTTLIVNLFVNYFGKENIGLMSNNKNFEYQNILNKSLIIFDEFDIEKINIDNFKKLISKEMVLGEKKGKEAELIKDTPILVLSNYSLENKLNMNENKEAITNRLEPVYFKERFSKKEMDIEINKKIQGEEAKIIVYCNRVYFNWVKKGKKNRMDDIKLIEKL